MGKVTEIRYESYLVRLWRSVERGDTARAPFPQAGESLIPEWLELALRDEAAGAVPYRDGRSEGEPKPLYAEVEHIQIGQRSSFDTVERLLTFLRGETESTTHETRSAVGAKHLVVAEP